MNYYPARSLLGGASELFGLLLLLLELMLRMRM